MPPKRVDPLVRFERHVSRPESGDGCWLWTGRARHPNGYGRFNLNERTVLSHRFAWEQVNGPIPSGLMVCHHCDTPACVNPAHLFLGTQADNMGDYAAKGRWKPRPNAPRGSVVKTSKLRESQVAQIKRLRRDGVSVKFLATEFGVTPENIRYIVNGITWRHVN